MILIAVRSLTIKTTRRARSPKAASTAKTHCVGPVLPSQLPRGHCTRTRGLQSFAWPAKKGKGPAHGSANFEAVIAGPVCSRTGRYQEHLYAHTCHIVGQQWQLLGAKRPGHHAHLEGRRTIQTGGHTSWKGSKWFGSFGGELTRRGNQSTHARQYDSCRGHGTGIKSCKVCATS